MRAFGLAFLEPPMRCRCSVYGGDCDFDPDFDPDFDFDFDFDPRTRDLAP